MKHFKRSLFNYNPLLTNCKASKSKPTLKMESLVLLINKTLKMASYKEIMAWNNDTKKGAMKRGWGTCGTFKVNNLMYHAGSSFKDTVN